MFQNRCAFLYNSGAFLISFFFFASHSRIVWISFYLETSSLEPFSLFIKKENGNVDKVIYFVLNHIIFIRKFFFTSVYFSAFNLKILLNQKLSSLKVKFVFVIDK